MSSTATANLPKKVKYVQADSETGASAYGWKDRAGNITPIRGLGNQNIPNTDIVVEGGQRKSIRYIAAVESIYVDEQIKQGYPRDYTFTDADKIKMENGELVIFPEQTPNLYHYVEKVSSNGSNPNRATGAKILFIREDKEAKAKDNLEQDRLIMRATNIVFGLENDIAKLRNIASTLSLDMNLEPAILLEQLMARAKTFPKMILDAAGDNAGDAAGLVWDAVEANVIHFTGFGWEFADSKDKISVPNMRGRQHEDNARKKLMEYLQTSEGESTRHMIETMVKNRK